ncbi:hypothetical protein I316_04709 [Kwoniella heveanensis BCC8398]|uniref:Uncharacterized protein n=1 Tax=Kwoniella heveanensis BCC8398 TaxID=1296120 RepID=A0A1B9GS10_9TREE|nr:hypothetical protein I316_04709 [Kwoniella heveanensis BCC8398]
MPPKSQPTSNVMVMVDYVHPEGNEDTTTFRVKSIWRRKPEDPWQEFTNPDIKMYDLHAAHPDDKPVTAETHHITSEALFGEAPLPIDDLKQATSELTSALEEALNKQDELDQYSEDVGRGVVNWERRFLEPKPISASNLSARAEDRVLAAKKRHEGRSDEFIEGDLKKFREQLDVSKRVLSDLASIGAISFGKEMQQQSEYQKTAISNYLERTKGTITEQTSQRCPADAPLVDKWADLATQSASSHTDAVMERIHRDSATMFSKSPAASSMGDLYNRKINAQAEAAGANRMKFRMAMAGFQAEFQKNHPDQGIPITVQDWTDAMDEDEKRVGAVRLRSVVTHPGGDTSRAKLYQIPEYSLDGRKTFRPFDGAALPGPEDTEWANTDVTVSTVLSGSLPSQHLVDEVRSKLDGGIGTAEALNARKKAVETEPLSEDPVTKARAQRELDMIDAIAFTASTQLQQKHAEVARSEHESFLESLDAEYNAAYDSLGASGQESRKERQRREEDARNLDYWSAYVEDVYNTKATASQSGMLESAKRMTDGSRFQGKYSMLEKKLADMGSLDTARIRLQGKTDRLSGISRNTYGLTSIPTSGKEWTDAFSQRS